MSASPNAERDPAAADPRSRSGDGRAPGRRLAARLRRRSGAPPDLSGRVDVLTGHVVDDLFTRVPAFTAVGEEFRPLVTAVVGRIVDTIVTSFTEQRPATRAELRDLVELCVPRTELGITLEDMLEVFQVSQETLWWELHRTADDGELTDPGIGLELSHLGVHVITELSRGVTTAYLEGDRIWLQRQDAERVFLRGLLSQPVKVEDAMRAARALGLAVFEDWRVGWYAPTTVGSIALPALRRSVSDARMNRGLAGASAILEGAVVLALGTDDEMPAPPPGAVLGIGRRHRGTQGLRESLAEARDAAEAARRRGRTTLNSEHSVLDRVFLGTMSTTDLADQVLADLDALPDGRREMLMETLEQWLDHAGAVTEAARTMSLHPQSLRHRLRRLREVLGDRMDDPEARLQLHVAVKARRLAPLPAPPN